MKLLYVITGLGIGGAEAITIDLANQMVNRGHSVLLIYLTGENRQVSRIDVRIKAVGLEMVKTPFNLYRTFLKSRKLIKEYKPDVVHAQMFHANLFCRLLRLFCSMPLLITTEHNKYIGGYLRMLLYRITDNLSDFNTNVSNEATCLFIQKRTFSKKKSFTIYNGIDMTKFFPSPTLSIQLRKYYNLRTDDFVFLNIGRLMPAKDHKNLIDAFMLLADRYQNMKMLIVGEGILYDELKKYIQEKKMTQRIILAGSHSNVVDYYNASDCFVLSSAWEGFGIVLAEAMACQLPVITTNAGGCAEVVDDDSYVVTTHNPLALSKKMEEVYLMPCPQRIALGEENRRKAQRFDLYKVCDQWLEIYTNRK